MTATKQDTTPQQAGILCNDEQFQRFVAYRMRNVLPDLEQATATGAAEYMRRVCQITSRRDLATNPTAKAKFQALRTDFDAWRGRIPAPR